MEAKNQMESRDLSFSVSDEYRGYRLDKGISEYYDDISRSRIAKLIKDGEVTVNGSVMKPSYVLEPGDLVSLSIGKAELPDIEPENIPLDVLYEDEAVIVVNKPKGMVVHPAAGHYSGTLVNALMYHCKDLSGINGVMRPGIVHRIDKDTTGSLIVCKNDTAHRDLAIQLAEHSIDRRYRAIVWGGFDTDEGTVDLPIGRDRRDRKKMSVDPGGKRAVTHYTVLERYREHSYIECALETGRTHQIRVHMTYLGHPILGDEVYGARKAKIKTFGQTLHAYYIGFVSPATGKRVEVTAPLPGYFENIMEKLGKQ